MASTDDTNAGFSLHVRGLGLRVVAGLVLTGIFLALFPLNSDAALAQFDGLAYGLHLEEGSVASPANHLLFHLLSWIAWSLLDRLGVEGAGYLAVKLVGALGGVAVLLIIVAMARARWRIGVLLALTLLVCRGFVFEAAAGDSLLPAVAASLWMIDLALRTPLDVRRLGLACILTLLFRQDGLLLLPGVAVAAGAAIPRGARLGVLVRLFATVGAVVLAAYLVTWWAMGAPDLVEFMLGVGTTRYAPPATGPAEDLMTHMIGLEGVTTGHVRASEWEALASGAACCLAWLLAAALLRGTGGVRRCVWLLLVTVVIRVPFYTWFEPGNWEWQLQTVVMILALSAHMVRGTATTSRIPVVVGATILVLLPAYLISAHGPTTWKLRECNLQEGVDEARRAGGGDCEYFARTGSAAYVFTARRITGIRRYPHDGAGFEMITRSYRESVRPLIVVDDVFALDGMPRSFAEEPESDLLTSLARFPGVTQFRRKGRVFAVGVRLE